MFLVCVAASLESKGGMRERRRSVQRTIRRFMVMEHRTSENSNTVSGDVEETDEAIMDKFFIVQGRMLMSLFRFCPQCGCRLGKAQLKAEEGAAAVVQYVCSTCSAKKWESQQRVLAHPRERNGKEML
ncbi:hypothetical protein OSTOST_24783 [Ostertagia ostertagi]